MLTQTKVSSRIATLAGILLAGVFFSAPVLADDTDSATTARCMLCSSDHCASPAPGATSSNFSAARDSSASSPDPMIVVEGMILGTTDRNHSRVAHVATRSNESDRTHSWDPMLIARKMIQSDSR